MPVSHVRLRTAAIVLLAAALSCGDSATGPRVAAVAVRVPHDSLFVGRTVDAVAVAVGDAADVDRARFIWTSSDTNVAVVDSLGRILGVSPGTVAIRAEFGGQRDTYTLRVVAQRADGGVQFIDGSLSYGPNACAISVDRAVFCRAAPTAGDSTPVFRRMPGAAGIEFTEVHASGPATCALSMDGLVYCWGRNGHWIFGTRTPSTEDFEPFAVVMRGVRLTRMTHNGHAQTCGIGVADSVVYCMGHNDFYQLMRPPKVASDSMLAPVAGSYQGRDVSTTNFSTCFIELDGRAYCTGGFGANENSLGVGAGREIGGTGEPAPVLGDHRFSAISAGEGFQCATTPAQEAYCWGVNSGGRLGIGTTLTPSEPGPQRVAGDLRFASVTVGYPTSACGITTDGDLYCWGAFMPTAVSARLGDRSTRPYHLMRGVKFRALTRNLSTVCGVTTDGTILCW